MQPLQSTTAIVTGASRGVGVYIAEAFAIQGIRTAICARSTHELEEVAQKLRDQGAEVLAITADVTKAADRDRIVRETQETFGQIDILINNAAIVEWTNFSNHPPLGIQSIVETNLLAPMFLARLLLPGMIDLGRGHIVNITSIAGWIGIPYEAAYSASKAGIIQWTNSLRIELEGTGVGVSLIAPTYISQVGMFARHGIPAPKLAGSVRPEQVSNAVIRAITRNLHEVIVRPGPTRPLLALNALSPSIGNAIIKAMGVVRIQRHLAESTHRSASHTAVPDA